MTEYANKHTDQNEQNKRDRSKGDDENCSHNIEIPAVRHVGPTLESDETKEGQELADAVSVIENTHSGISRYDPELDALPSRQEPEPLKTWLPGDSSSDPHTDLDDDNVAPIQQRGETNRKQRSATRGK